MTSTFSALELKPDGDVSLVKIKATSGKPSLKDIQSHLKKKTAPAVLTTYPNGPKRVTMIGYTKGKEAEISQQQLPPPYEAAELYGSVLLICHSIKTNWDTSLSEIEPFNPADYEVFYEKACSGELDETEDIEEDEQGEENAEHDEDGDLQEIEDDEEDEDQQEDEGELGEDELIDEPVEEVHHKVRVSRKAIKVDPQQLQFQFKSILVPEDTSSLEAITAIPLRFKTFSTLQELVGEHCDENDLLQLERGIYNASLEEAKRRMVPLTWDHTNFKWVYGMVAKRTASNFQPDSYVQNTDLIARWKDGEFTLDQIAHWSPYDLKPSHWKDLKDQQFRRDKRILEGNLAMATDRFRCSRCQKKMCTYYELQTRSADEPMTIFISCVNCGKQWKQ